MIRRGRKNREILLQQIEDKYVREMEQKMRREYKRKHFKRGKKKPKIDKEPR